MNFLSGFKLIIIYKKTESSLLICNQHLRLVLTGVNYAAF